MARNESPERREGARDRRAAKSERRNPERATEDLVPRRNPDRPDRRKST